MKRPVSLPLLTQSELRSFRRCPREWAYAYGQQLRAARVDPALTFGSVVHRALEAWWASGGDLSSALAHLADLHDPYSRAQADAMLTAYSVYWRGALDDLEVIGLEVPFEAPLVNPLTGEHSRTWRLAGQLDGLVRERATGRVWILEHKTTSDDITPGAPYWQRLRLDAQVAIYHHGARALGYEPSGVLYDVLRKPSLRPLEPGQRRKSPETPDEFRGRLLIQLEVDTARFLQRQEVVLLASDEQEAALDTWQSAQSLRDTQRLGRFARNGDACMRWGRACDYLPLCLGTAQPDDARYRKASAKHEELRPMSTPNPQAAE